MDKQHLFLVEDGGEEIYIVANTYGQAVIKWEQKLVADGCAPQDIKHPDAVMFIAEYVLL